MLGDMKAQRVWWLLLNKRMEQVRLGLPRKLKGVVQFEIASLGGNVDFFYLDLQGQRSKGYDGIADDHDVWVNTTEEELSQLLYTDEIAPGALRADGDVKLLTTFFDKVAAAAPAKSALSLRAGS